MFAAVMMNMHMLSGEYTPQGVRNSCRMTTWFLSALFTVGKPRKTAQNTPEGFEVYPQLSDR